MNEEIELIKDLANRLSGAGIEGVPVSVVSPEDLVLSKLAWAKTSGSELQLRDVRQMMLAVQDLDGEYLRRWSGVLGVEELLNKVRNHE